MACPCCGNPSNPYDPESGEARTCPICGHRWFADGAASNIDYATQHHRNTPVSEAHKRKIADRMATLLPLLRPGMNVLEIGCAEGSLGTAVKQAIPVSYTGIEPSGDATVASSVLDRVVGNSRLLGSAQFDLLLCFHVVEHIANIGDEIASWRKLLAPGATLVLEVPNRAGHPLLSKDPNIEHLHQFNTASLVTLMHRSRFEVRALSTNHWESAVYSDCLRVTATPAIEPRLQFEACVRRFRSLLPEPFVAWGIGGDFRGYVEPWLDELPIVGLIDSSPQRHGKRVGRFQIEAYDPARHSGMPVLICSLRFRASIESDIERLGANPRHVVGLDDIFAPPAN